MAGSGLCCCNFRKTAAVWISLVEVPAFPGSVQPQLFQDVVGLVVCLAVEALMKPVNVETSPPLLTHHNHRILTP